MFTGWVAFVAVPPPKLVKLPVADPMKLTPPVTVGWPVIERSPFVCTLASGRVHAVCAHDVGTR